MGLGTEAGFQGDLRHGHVFHKNQCLCLFNPLLCNIIIGGKAFTVQKYRVQMIGRYMCAFGNLRQGAAFAVMGIHVAVSFPNQPVTYRTVAAATGQLQT